MRFSVLYSGEQILSFKVCLVFYAGDSLKSGGLHFLNVFYHLKLLGWSSAFRAIDDLPRAHGDETVFY